MNQKRFGTESNVNHQIESNRLAKDAYTVGSTGGAARKKVTLQTHSYDKYGRTLADVLLPDGTNVNYTLVKEGWCWWYRKYAPRNTTLERLETEAREVRRGLWVDRTLFHRGSGDDLVEVGKVLVADATFDTSPRAA